jgi:uncharacterized protein (TIGR02246 family)
VIAFNEAINRRDVGALAELMTDDHTFVDSAGSVLAGKDEVLAAWEGFFESFPDNGPAIWTAKTLDGKVSEWRVYEDTPANRRRLGI